MKLAGKGAKNRGSDRESETLQRMWESEEEVWNGKE